MDLGRLQTAARIALNSALDHQERYYNYTRKTAWSSKSVHLLKEILKPSFQDRLDKYLVVYDVLTILQRWRGPTARHIKTMMREAIGE